MKMLLLLPFAIAAGTDFRVEQTFNSEPFVCREVGLEEREAYWVFDLRYPSPVKTDVEANNTVPARYFLPAGIDDSSTPRPGVVCLHILGGKFELVELTCATLARRGIPALWLKLPFYGERRPAGSKLDLARHPDRFAAALGQGIADVRRAIDVLAARPEVDPERVNVMGISLGGIVAASTAAIDPRVNRAALLLAGGDAMTIIDEAPECRDLKNAIAELEPDERTKVERSIGQVDPLTHAPSLRERAGQGRVLMINAACDEVIPRRCTERLAAALGMADRVVWLEGLGHYTALAALPQALNTTVDFFAQDLPAEARRSTSDAEKNTQASAVANGHNATEQSPLHRLVGIIQQVGVLVRTDQQPGSERCHLADLDITVTPDDGDPVQAEAQLIRGHDHQFRLEVESEKIGRFMLGQGSCPWLCGRGTIFLGTFAEGDERRDPLCDVEPNNIVTVRAALGLVTVLQLAPEMLGKWVKVTLPSAQELRIDRNDRTDDHIVLVYDGATPREATFSVEGVQGSIRFRAWAFDAPAHPSMFAPPADSDTFEVPARDVYRMMGALLNFAVEAAR